MLQVLFTRRDFLRTAFAGPLAAAVAPLLAARPAAAQDVFYQADWSSGLGAWAASQDWTTVDGMLVNDGSTSLVNSIALAPVSVPVADYAVEVEIQAILPSGLWNPAAFFGVVSRRGQGTAGGYIGYAGNFGRGDLAGIDALVSGERWWLQDTGFPHGQRWHAYRFEARGSTLRLLIDGVPRLELVNTLYPSGDQVGVSMYTTGSVRLNVRSFRVLAL